MKYSVKLVNKKEVAKDTYVFFFEKPSGFNFRSGQYLTMALIDPKETDVNGNKRDFSIASAPHEEHLEVTTRAGRTAFKKVLQELPLGSEVSIDGPFGSFTLHKDTNKPFVVLAGGIGITPFISMIREIMHGGFLYETTVFYSNRRPEDSAYLEELKSLESANFKLAATMTNMKDSEGVWSGEQGYISEDMVRRYVSNLQNPIFYSAGPPKFVTAMWQMLTKMGVSEDSIRTEEFAGY